MPRLSHDEVEKREKFILKVFKNNPGLTIARANKMLKAEFGAGEMRNMKVSELRLRSGYVHPAVRRGRPPGKKPPGTKNGKLKAATVDAAPPEPVAPVTAAGRKAGPVSQDKLPIVVHLKGLDATAAVSATLDALRKAGLTNLTVELKKEAKYVLIDRAQ